MAEDRAKGLLLRIAVLDITFVQNGRLCIYFFVEI